MAIPARTGDTDNEIIDGETLSARVAFFVWGGTLESVTVNVSGEALAVAVGAPLMTPVVAFNDKPAGNVPEVSFQL